ncbi:acyltransferase [Dokdonia sinensis]|uniref:Acyltransferase n=1 Tax=Dokdonia sinensis TaxID=2479847 RepID=A0A3M0GF72_9FLAO|nr:acyltransferase [Dokdonia sinensis]RMB62948.1 acyltransferase [Dokdonia sinensis]
MVSILKEQNIQNRRIFGLDLMRAIAILAVLGSHTLWIFPEATGTLPSLLKFGGVMGVELFFVLSGFLIGRILFKIFTKDDFTIVDLKYFLVRRWFRTLPNYYLILILNIILVSAIGRALPDSLPLYFGFLQNMTSGMDIFFTESWSLPVEEVAYVVGPFLLYVVVSAFAKAKKETIFLFTTLSIILTFLMTKVFYNLHVANSSLDYWNINLKAVVLYRLDAIYYGVLAAYLSLKHPDFWKRNSGFLGIAGVVLFLGFQWILGKYQLSIAQAPFIWNVLYLPVVSISFCFFLPFLSQWKKAPKFIGKPIFTLSIISYAVYLLHYGILLQGMRWLQPIEGLNNNERLLFAGIYLLLTILISYLWYRIYEKPMTDLRDHPKIKGLFDR